MRLLVTGFTAFPGQPENPTQQLVEFLQSGGPTLPGFNLSAHLLPVEYRGVEREFLRLLHLHQPDLWLAFGVCRRPQPLHLESRGRNRDDTARPDNAGEIRQGSPIVPNAPDVLETSIELERLQVSLQDAGFPTEISDSAGSYVCNHMLYFALHHLKQSSLNCEFLFTHVAPPEFGLSTENLSVALQIMAGWFQNRRRDNQIQQLA